jgi:hypothetical protein
VTPVKGSGMYRYKGFDSASVGGDVSRLESVVNEWMEHQRPRIRYVAQSQHGEHVVLSFVYEMGGEATREMAQKVAVPEVFERQLDDAELDPDEMDDPGLPEADLPY